MRKIFLDGGANNGSSIEMFLNKFKNSSEYEIYSFECNPVLLKVIEDKYSKKATILPYAISTEDGELDFYLGIHYASSLRKDKKTGNLDFKKPIKVKSINLSKYIIDNFNKDDYIILKLDIEGSEYDVLPHLIKTGAIYYINELYGEYHYKKLKNISEDFHIELVSNLEQIGFTMVNWDATSSTIG